MDIMGSWTDALDLWADRVVEKMPTLLGGASLDADRIGATLKDRGLDPIAHTARFQAELVDHIVRCWSEYRTVQKRLRASIRCPDEDDSP